MTLLSERSTAWAARGRRKALSLEMRCISVWQDALLDEERDELVGRAKVVVNVHTYPSSSLEVHRYTGTLLALNNHSHKAHLNALTATAFTVTKLH